MRTDPAHKLTDDMLAELEGSVSGIYAKAGKQLRKLLRELMQEIEPELKAWEQQVESGEKTEAQFRQWKMEKLMRSKKAKEINRQITDLVYQTNTDAAQAGNAIINGVTALNANYALYEYEGITDGR